MTDNDVSTYELELVRSGASSDMVASIQPNAVYTSSGFSNGGISNQMVIIVLAIIIGVVAIAYLRNCNCGGR